MPMFTICTVIVQEGQLEKELRGMSEGEKKFTQEIGVWSEISINAFNSLTSYGATQNGQENTPTTTQPKA